MLDSQALRSMAKHSFRCIKYRKPKKSSQNSRNPEISVDIYHLWFISLRSFSKKRSSRSELYTRSENFACKTKMNEIDEYMLAQPSRNAYASYRLSKLENVGRILSHSKET